MPHKKSWRKIQSTANKIAPLVLDQTSAGLWSVRVISRVNAHAVWRKHPERVRSKRIQKGLTSNVTRCQ